jgi:hypothetical protein
MYLYAYCTFPAPNFSGCFVFCEELGYRSLDILCSPQDTCVVGLTGLLVLRPDNRLY